MIHPETKRELQELMNAFREKITAFKSALDNMLEIYSERLKELQAELQSIESTLSNLEEMQEPPTPPQEPILPTVEIVGFQDANGAISILYTGDAAAYEFHISNGVRPYVVAVDQAPPLTIQLGSPLSENLDQHEGKFTGSLHGYVIPLDADGLPGLQEEFSYKFDDPTPTDPPKPPQPDPIRRQLNIKAVYEHEINTRAKERNQGNLATKGGHPSLRTVQLLEGKARVMTGSAGWIYDPDAEEFTKQVLTGGGHTKAELSPWDLDHYFYIKDSTFRSSKDGVLFVKQRAEQEYGKTFQNIISGANEHLLVNDKGIAGFYGHEGRRGTAFFYDALEKKFLPDSWDFDLRHAPADFCGMAGDGLILKNIRQGDENWHDPFQWFPQDANGANPPREVERNGMNHSATQKDLFVSTAGWYLKLPSMTPISLGVQLDTAEHVGQVWGMPGWFCANAKNGTVKVFNILGDEYFLADDCKRQSYPIAFLHRDLLHLLITTNAGVFMRKFTI